MNRCLIALSTLVLASAGSAQNEEATAAARALFHEGVACADASDLPCAADRWRRSLELRDSAVVRYNLANAERDLGHFVVAVELLRRVEREADADEALREAARATRLETEPRLARVTIDVEAAGADILLDGSPFASALWGVGMPLDPGPHRLDAERDVSVASLTFEVSEGEARSLAFRVPPAPVSEPDVPTASELAATTQPESEPGPDVFADEDDGSPRRRRRILGVSLGIAVALALGVVIAVVASPDAATPTPTDLPPLEFR